MNNDGTDIAVYMDDLHIVGLDLLLIIKFNNKLVAKFKIIDLESTFHHLEMKVSHNNYTITVTQTVYINQLFAVDRIPNCNLPYTPMIEGLCLVPAPDNYISNLKEISAYQRFTESI